MRDDHAIARLCEDLQVSPSGFHGWDRRRPAPGFRAREDQVLAGQTTAIHAGSRQTCGSPRIADELRARGRRHGRNRIARLMKGRGICGRQKGRHRVRTTDSDHDPPIAPDRLAEAPQAAASNPVRVADITCIPTDEGWLCLAGVLDLHSRKIVGWAMSPAIAPALVLSALSMAPPHRSPPPGLLSHSDRGVRHAAGNFRAALKAAGPVASMSRRGNCHDNASMESFWSTLELGLAYRGRFTGHRHARPEIFDFIELFYNRQRRHTSLGGLSPAHFETENN